MWEAQIFKKWMFPSKQILTPSIDSLKGRVKELWEANTSQKEMLRILSREGFKVTERELSRIRKQEGFALRTANGMKTVPTEASTGSVDDISSLPMFNNSPELVAKRRQRQEELKTESDKRLAAKTRRVRTRKYGSLPADPPMPPRFPSEMTIGQSKAMLKLTQDQYTRMRNRFQIMCEAENITKKTECSHKWKVVKESLIEETSYLQTVIHINPSDDIERKLQKDRLMALDIICCDVTKKIRTSKTRITIPDAKSTLGVNPKEANEIRKLFYEILIKNHFTSKMEAGQEQWDSMKAELKSESKILKNILKPESEDPRHATKEKSLEVICRDVMKRLRDDQTKMEKSGRSTSEHSLRGNHILQNEQPSPNHSFSNTQILHNNQSPPIDSFPGTHILQNEQPLALTSFSNTHILQNEQSLAVSSFPNTYIFQNQQSLAGSSFPETDDHFYDQSGSNLEDTHNVDYGDFPLDPSLPGVHIQHQIPTVHHKPSYRFRIEPTSELQEEPMEWMASLSVPPTMTSLKWSALAHHEELRQLGVGPVKIEACTPTITTPIAIKEDEDLESFLHSAGHEQVTFNLHLDYPFKLPPKRRNAS